METLIPYTFIPQLDELMETIQTDSIISRTVYKDQHLKAILFGFDAGQELSEHTSSQNAVIHILRGRGTVTLGDDDYAVEAGSWVHMPARLKHGVQAESPLVMLLLMYGTE